MPPRWFNDCIFSFNYQTFGSEQLIIIDVGNNGKHYSTSVDNGNCPKEFISFLFGDSTQSTSVTTANMLDKDVYNCDFDYKPEYGDFSFHSDVATRMNSQLPWICFNYTTDKLN